MTPTERALMSTYSKAYKNGFAAARAKAVEIANTLTKELDEESTDKVFSRKFKQAIKNMNGSVVSDECAVRLAEMKP